MGTLGLGVIGGGLLKRDNKTTFSRKHVLFENGTYIYISSQNIDLSLQDWIKLGMVNKNNG